MSENNFSNTLVSVDYSIFSKVMPCHDELEAAVATALQSHFASNPSGEGLKFLDIGAGYGFTSKLVVEVLPQANYILNEFDEATLNRVDAHIGAFNHTKMVGDIEEVIKGIPDASLDAVYTAWVLHNFSEVKRATVIEEVSRVLKPGGCFTSLDKVCNIGYDRQKYFAEMLQALYVFVTTYNRPDLYFEWVKHYVRDEELCILFTEDEFESLFVKNNFTWKWTKHNLLERVVCAVKKS